MHASQARSMVLESGREGAASSKNLDKQNKKKKEISQNHKNPNPGGLGDGDLRSVPLASISLC